MRSVVLDCAHDEAKGRTPRAGDAWDQVAHDDAAGSGERAGEQRERDRRPGLGLFISRQIVEAHGGRIAFEDGHREGASFVVELPLR